MEKRDIQTEGQYKKYRAWYAKKLEQEIF